MTPMTKTYSASNKQLSFISTLITQLAELDSECAAAHSIYAKTANLTGGYSGTASQLINQLKADIAEARAEARQAATAAVAEVENARIDHGFHQVTIDGNEVILKVVRPKHNAKGRPYAYGVKAEWPEHFWAAEESTGRWFYLGRTYNHLLSDATLLDATQAAAFGHKHGWCIVCSAKLEDPESRHDGIGPSCYRTITGETKAQARKNSNLAPLPADVAAELKAHRATLKSNREAEKRALYEAKELCNA